MSSTGLKWFNLSHEVDTNVSLLNMIKNKSDKKLILKPQNGSIRTGSLIAVMGPSGAGKSTLLNCVTGHISGHGLSGSIKVSSHGQDGPNVRISMVPQTDHLFRKFTVHETLNFASKMKNLNPSHDHNFDVKTIINQLNLEDCNDLPIEQCSGGQVKRVSIGVELVSHPDILALDEPTSGLDSSTALQCVQLLKGLVQCAKFPIAIIATIHQPNYKLFTMFTSIYLLSRNGQHIYSGPPDKLSPYLEQFNLRCPQYCNPADFAIEVAYGDHGQDHFNDMELKTLSVTTGHEDIRNDDQWIDLNDVVKSDATKMRTSLRHLKLLTIRSWINMIRDSNGFLFNNLQALIVAITLSFIHTNYVGVDDACWESSFKSDEQSIDGTKRINASVAMDAYAAKMTAMIDNTAFMFACLIHTTAITLIMSILLFPLEARIIIKEIRNNWYNVHSYFMSKIITELPSRVMPIVTLIAIVYPATGQIPDLWRFLLLLTIICLVSDICQSIGMAFGIILNHDLVSAMVLTAASAFPVLMFAGFVIHIQSMPWFFKPVSNLSYLKFAYQASLITIYGFDRCSPSNGSTFVDDLVHAFNPMTIARDFVSKINATNMDIYRFSNILDTDNNCLSHVYNKSVDYFEPNIDTNDQRHEKDGLDMDKGNDYSSYVLSYYGLSDGDIYTNICALMTYLVIAKLIVLFLMKRKASL